MEPPNKLMIMQVLGCFRDDSMIPNGLMRIFSGAPCVIRGVLGDIGVIWPKLLANDGRHGRGESQRECSRSRAATGDRRPIFRKLAA